MRWKVEIRLDGPKRDAWLSLMWWRKRPPDRYFKLKVMRGRILLRLYRIILTLGVARHNGR